MARPLHRQLLLGSSDESDDIPVGIAKMGKDPTPRLLLGWLDEVDSARDKALVRGENIRNLERDPHEAPDKGAPFRVGRIHPLEGELTLTAGQLRPSRRIVPRRRRNPQRLRVEANRTLPVRDEDSDNGQLVLPMTPRSGRSPDQSQPERLKR